MLKIETGLWMPIDHAKSMYTYLQVNVSGIGMGVSGANSGILNNSCWTFQDICAILMLDLIFLQRLLNLFRGIQLCECHLQVPTSVQILSDTNLRALIIRRTAVLGVILAGSFSGPGTNITGCPYYFDHVNTNGVSSYVFFTKGRYISWICRKRFRQLHRSSDVISLIDLCQFTIILLCAAVYTFGKRLQKLTICDHRS